MLTILIKGEDLWDEEKQEFIPLPDFVLELEHSLISLSKWESRFQKPFLGATKLNPHTTEEILGYVEAMILTPNYPEEIWARFSKENLQAINDYIESPQSATTFGKLPQNRGRTEIITSELIYYWLVAFTISFEVEAWHLNRLFALIRICNVKNGKQPKRSMAEIARERAEINAQRRAKLGTSG